MDFRSNDFNPEFRIKQIYKINIFQRSVAVINLPISCVLHSSKSSGPAAWCILSLKTPLLLRDSFVVFTIAMAFNLVISPALK